MFCTRARSCARADDAKIMRSRNAQCKTHTRLPKKKKKTLIMLKVFKGQLSRIKGEFERCVPRFIYTTSSFHGKVKCCASEVYVEDVFMSLRKYCRGIFNMSY